MAHVTMDKRIAAVAERDPQQERKCMPEKQQRRSEIWWRGHNDALAGDPPNESYYHYYYEYKLAYDQVRRQQRRTRRQRSLAAFGRRMLYIGPILLLLGGLGAWAVSRANSTDSTADVVIPTRTPRPTPRPTLPPPTATPLPVLRADGFAVITGTQGSPLLMRANPGRKGAVQARIPEGVLVRILEGPQAADGNDWWRIEADGKSGWSAAPYLQPVEQPSQ